MLGGILEDLKPLNRSKTCSRSKDSLFRLRKRDTTLALTLELSGMVTYVDSQPSDLKFLPKS